MVISFVKKYNRLLSVSCRVGDLSLSFSCRVGEYFFVCQLLSASWLSVSCLSVSCGYPQLRTCKNNCIFFIFVYATFLTVITHVFLLNHRECACIFTLIVCLSRVPEANLVPLLTLLASTLQSFIFRLNTWLDADILFIKLDLYCALASKKINTRLAFVFYLNGNKMDQMVRNDIACNCIPIDGIAFPYAHI